MYALKQYPDMSFNYKVRIVWIRQKDSDRVHAYSSFDSPWCEDVRLVMDPDGCKDEEGTRCPYCIMALKAYYKAIANTLNINNISKIENTEEKFSSSTPPFFK